MDLPIIIAISATLFFGILAIFYSIKEEKLKKALNENEKKLQEALVREKHDLTSLVGNLDDGLFLVDVNSRLTLINKTAKDFLGLQKDNPSIIDVLSSLPNTYNFGERIEKAIKLNQKIEEKNILHDNKSFNVTINPILAPNDVSSVLGLAPRSPAERNEQEVKVTGASFLIHDVTLEKSLSKMKEDFTSIIVHELRSPLTSIKASSEMLTGGTNLTDDEKKRLIGIISVQTGKMLDEVSTILDAAKLDNGLFTIQKTNGDVKKVIAEAVEAYKHLAENKSIHLVCQIDPLVPEASFESYQIRKVINNLLTNSLKFTSSGGTITIRAWIDNEKISISVSDTGIGIPKEKQHLLFSKFTQIRSPNATVGTGLGLYISKGIVEAHGGTIALVSDPDKGTTITFTIPINSTTKNLASTPNPTPSPPDIIGVKSGPSEKPINHLAN